MAHLVHALASRAKLWCSHAMTDRPPVPPAPSFAASTILDFVQVLERLGVDGAALCAEAGVALEDLTEPEARVSADAHRALWASARGALGREHLGLLVGELSTFGRWGALEFVLLSGRSLRHAAERAIRYWPLVSDDAKVITLVQRAPGTASIEFHSPHCGEPDAFEADMVYLLRLLRHGVDPRFVPLSVSFAHPARGELESYRRVFGVTPRFGAPVQSLELPAELVDQSLRTTFTALSAQLEEQAERELARLQGSLAERVSAAVHADLRAASVEQVAVALSMSVRTLQRRLTEAGLSFRDLLDDARRAVALRELAETDHSLAEIAHRLGFNDVSAFSRAVRRWFARTPQNVRQQGGLPGPTG